MTDWRRAEGFVGLIAGRWTLALLTELASQGRRYQHLHDALEGISHKVLTDTLRRMERDGLIRRELDPDRVKAATLYRLTELGESLGEPLAILCSWLDTNSSRVEEAREYWAVRIENR